MLTHDSACAGTTDLNFFTTLTVM